MKTLQEFINNPVIVESITNGKDLYEKLINPSNYPEIVDEFISNLKSMGIKKIPKSKWKNIDKGKKYVAIHQIDDDRCYIHFLTYYKFYSDTCSIEYSNNKIKEIPTHETSAVEIKVCDLYELPEQYTNIIELIK